LNKLLQQVNHKPFNSSSEQHKKATLHLIERLQAFQQENNINLSNEIEVLQHQTINN